MNPTSTSLRIGAWRGLVELRQTFVNRQELMALLIPSVSLLVALFLMRDGKVGPTGFSLGAATLPGALGMNIVFTGITGLAQTLVVEREDGTLLRAKATPNGMLTYLVGKVVGVSIAAIAGLLLLLIPGSFFLDGLALNSAGAWLGLLGILILGLAASLPIGAVIGSLFSNPRSFGAVMLPIIALVAISGIFYPINGNPWWLQGIAQVFPIYWLGLGMRAALLPDNMSVIEIGESWRHLETVGVLAAWALIGIFVAPIVLRRMARRESGSSMSERREKALQRVN
jgi:ABC-2 type transport system permease protein